MQSYNFDDLEVAEAMFWYSNVIENYNALCKANEEDEISVAQWIWDYRLKDFNKFCIDNYGFCIKECQV